MDEFEALLLRERRKREPPEPRWKVVAVYGAAGAIGALLLLNIVSGLLGNGWNW